MKGLILFVVLLVSLASCAQNGYSPSYIISDVEKESYEVDE